MPRYRSLRLLHPGWVAFAILFSAYSAYVFSQDTDSEAVRHFRAAQQAQNAGSLDVAVREYLEVIHLRPEVAEAHASLGLVYNAQGKFADSARVLNKAEKLKPGLPGVSLYLGIDYVRLHQPGLAVPQLIDAVRIEPTNRQTQTWLGRALWNDGQTQAALEQLSKTSLLFPSDYPLLLELGEAYRKAADQGIRNVLTGANGKPFLHQVYGDIYKDERAWEKAMAHYYRALDEDPRWPGAHFGLGEVALHREKLDDAAQEYRRELQINPRSAAALARLAEIKMLKGRPTDALALFDSAIHVAPDQASNALGLPRPYPATTEDLSEDAQEKLRECLPALEGAPAGPSRGLALAIVNSRSGGGKDNAFISAWKEFQSTVPHSNPSNLYERGIDSYDRQDFHAAEIDLNKWLKLHPSDLRAEYLLARAYRNLSLSILEELLAAAPNSYPAHQLLAETYQNSGKDEQALAEYRVVENAVTNLRGVHFSIGHLLLKMGQQDQAIGEFAAELRLTPDHAEANAEMGTILLSQLELAQAIPYLEKAVQLDPDLWATHRQLGKAYYLQKDFKKAETALQQAIQHDPDGLAHYQLGMVYRDQGQKEAAREQFDISRRLKLENLTHAETQMTTLETLPQ